MALSSTTLANLIKAKLSASLPISDPAETEKLAKAIAEAVVEHFKAAAVVAMKNGGIDSNGDTLATNEGTVT